MAAILQFWVVWSVYTVAIRAFHAGRMVGAQHVERAEDPRCGLRIVRGWAQALDASMKGGLEVISNPSPTPPCKLTVLRSAGSSVPTSTSG